MRLVPAISLLVLLATSAPATSVAAPSPSPSPAPPETGAALYARYCGVCHGASMEGHAADNAPSLANPTFRSTATDAFLRAAIDRGRAGTAMAGYGQAFGGPLGPAEVTALITHIRGGIRAPRLPRKPANGNASNGGALYATHCQSCHGTSEQRASAVHLANAMFLATAGDAYLRAAIVLGRPGTPMKAWNDTLSAAEIEDVVTYVRSLARPVPPAPVVPAPVAGGAQEPAIENVPVVVNPDGEQAELTLRDDRYASVADVAKAYHEKRRLVFVDARTTSDYLRMHIAGAVSIPYFNMRDIDKIPNDGTWVISYCACPHHVSGIIVDELRKRGYAHSAVLDEGIFVWQQQGNPVVAAEGQLPFPAPPSAGAAPPVIPHVGVGEMLQPPPR